MKLPALYVTFERAEDAERLVAAYAKFSCSTKPQVAMEQLSCCACRIRDPCTLQLAYSCSVAAAEVRGEEARMQACAGAEQR